MSLNIWNKVNPSFTIKLGLKVLEPLKPSHRIYMLANVRFDKNSCDSERRKQYKSRADDVLLSRSHKNQTSAALKCNSPQSAESIFDMLSACLEK